MNPLQVLSLTVRLLGPMNVVQRAEILKEIKVASGMMRVHTIKSSLDFDARVCARDIVGACPCDFDTLVLVLKEEFKKPSWI